jgi:hypothetical protein
MLSFEIWGSVFAENLSFLKYYLVLTGKYLKMF